MSKPTLLSLVTKGKYKTSKDLPPIDDKLQFAMEMLGTPTKAKEPSLVNLALALPFVGPISKVKKALDSTKKFDKYMSAGGMNRRKYLDDVASGQKTYDIKKLATESKEYVKNWMDTYRADTDQIKKRMFTQNLDDVPVQFKDLKWNPAPGGSSTIGQYSPSQNAVRINRKLFYDPDWMRAFAYSMKRTPENVTKANLIHEYVHALTRGNRGLGKRFKALVDDALQESIRTDGASKLPGWKYKSVISGRSIPMDIKYWDYLREPTEVYARIFELRYDLGETALELSKGYTKLDPKLKKVNKAYAELSTILSDKQIERLYNKLPALLPFGSIPLAKGKDDKNRKY